MAAATIIPAGFHRLMAHELRPTILAAIKERGPLSPVTFARDTDERLGVVAYHYRILKDAGLIEVTAELPRRGAVQHFYSLTKLGRELVDECCPTCGRAMGVE